MKMYFFKSAVEKLRTQEIDPVNHTIKVALFTSGYVPNQNTQVNFNDISANEVVGTGYTQGGKALTGNQEITSGDYRNVFKYDTLYRWTTATITARYAVIYDDSHANKALIGFIPFLDSQGVPADKSSTAGNFDLTLPADGLFGMSIEQYV